MAFRPTQLRPVLLFVLVGLAIAAAGLFLLPRRSGATVRLLVVPRSDVAEAAHGVRVLAAVVESSDFFTKVAAQDPQISWADFGDKDADRRARWQKTIRSQTDEKTGLLTLSVLHRDREQAGRIAQAVADVLVRRGGEYLAGNPQVLVVDPPL
ncbi:hypothetical protein EPO33_02855 [Patescibacteria group bacterium]|nr:MAG: hypothetical protein EPO33_02855 [Patescibacteria group bacterium]